MANTNCPKHGTPLNGFGNLTFCNACDAEAAGAVTAAAKEDSEYITIYRKERYTHSTIGSNLYPLRPHGDDVVPWRVVRARRVVAEGGNVFLHAGAIATRLITIYRASHSDFPELVCRSYSTKPKGDVNIPWWIPETAVDETGASHVLVKPGTIAEKVKV